MFHMFILWMYYAAVLAVVSAAVGAVGLVVARKFRMIQRVLVMGVGALIRRIGDGDVLEDEGWITARNVVLKKSVLGGMYGLGTQVTDVRVESIEVSVPSWKEPIRLVLRGTRVSAQQMWVAPEKKEASSAIADGHGRHKEVLSLIDEVLWGVSGNARPQGSNIPLVGRYIDQIKSTVLYGIIQFTIQCVHIELDNTSLYYMQHGEPGPRPAQCKYSGRDGLCLTLRRVLLQPVTKESVSLVDVPSEDISHMESWTDAMVALPSFFMSKKSLERVSSTSLGISGVSLDLLTYPDTWGSGEPHGLSEGRHVSSFSFPKYSKLGESSEKKKLERLKNTKGYTFASQFDASQGVNLDLADEEVHRVIEQWELSVVLQIIPPGLEAVEKIEEQTLLPEDEASPSVEGTETIEDESEDESEEDPEDEVQMASERNSRCLKEVVQSQNSKFSVSLNVDIKALLVDVNVASLGILERLLGRHSLFSKYEPYWKRRPNVPVPSNEIAWWHHAGNVAVAEARRVVWMQVPQSRMEARRRARLKYQPLYVAKFARKAMFRDPNRRWYQRNTVAAMDEAGLKDLAAIEEGLTLEEIAHFRLMAALQYNHALSSSSVLKHFTATKIDYIITQAMAGNELNRDILLHLDREVSVRPFDLHISASCSKISTALDTKRSLRGTVHPDIMFLVCSLKHAHVTWQLGGETRISVSSFEVGPAKAQTGKLTYVSATSPSLLCHRVCRAADFTRYTVTGNVRAETMDSGDTCFAKIVISPRKGEGGMLVRDDIVSDSIVEDMIKQWKPSGTDIDVKIAAIGSRITEFRAHDDKSRVVLELIGFYRNSNSYLRRWSGSGEEHLITKGMHPPLSESAPSIADMLQDACSKTSTATTSYRNLSWMTLRLECPGIALQLPYTYKYSLTQKAAMESAAPFSGEAEQMSAFDASKQIDPDNFTQTHYMLTAAVQNIHLSIMNEDVDRYFDNCAVKRAEASGMIDVFSYLSEEERRDVTRKLAPSRFVYDADTREFKQVASGVRTFRKKLRQLEITSMAKVWAHPEDMPIILKGAEERTPQLDFAEGRKQTSSSRLSSSQINLDGASESQVPALTMLEKGRYPIPIIPFVKSYGLLASLASGISGLPQVPGERSNSIGVLVRGIQMWLSPLQISHISSIMNAVKRKVEESGTALSNPKEAELVENETPTNSRSTIQVKVQVQEISLMWLIGTWVVQKSKPRRSLKTWGLTVKKSDPAFVWAQWLAPLYSVGISGLNFTMRKGEQGSISMKANSRGIIVRDLQLSELARHAYVLRPLPARAKRIFTSLVAVRREVLGVKEPSVCVRYWRRAAALVMLRQQIRVETGKEIRYLPSLFDSELDTCGAQFEVKYMSSKGEDNVDVADLNVEVGQLLGYIRVKQNASLASFLSQVSKAREVASDAPEVPQAVSEGKASGYQNGLKVIVNMAGVDLTGRLQSQDLFSLKLQQGYLALNKKSVTKYSNPDDIRLHLAAKVDNLTLCDLRASAEHQLVLSPSNGAHSCALEIYYTAKVDEVKYAPTLVLDVSNPRILLLFRFINDALSGVEVITHAVSPLQEKEKGTSSKKQEADQKEDSKPLNLILNVRSIEIIVPTGQMTKTVLNVSVGEIVLATPGSALPDKVLDEADLPLMQDAINESLVCSRTYLYADFSREKARRRQDHRRNKEPDDEIKSELEPVEVDQVEIHDASQAQSEKTTGKPSKRRKREKRAPSNSMSGVLLFEDQYDMKTLSNANVGVLSLPEKITERTMHDGLEDNILARPAATLNKVGKALRGFVGQKQDEEPITQPVVDTAEMNIQNVSETEEDFEAQEEELFIVHDASFALCVVDMKILPGTLVRVPAANVKENGSNQSGLHHVTTYAHQSFQIYEVLGQDEFIEPLNIMLVMFEYKEHQQLHISLSDFHLLLSSPVYGTIMDFVSGNLGDFLGSGEDSSHFKEIRFNERMLFGPSSDANTNFRFTLALPEIECIMAAHPREWMVDKPEFIYTTSEESSQLLPFFRISVANMIMNLITLDSGDTYMNFCSTRVDMQDLRLGYRLNKISTDLSTKAPEPMESEMYEVSQLEPASPGFSVSRRLSEHSEKHRSSLMGKDLKKMINLDRTGDNIKDIRSKNYSIPVIDFTSAPAVRSVVGDDAACYRIATTDVDMSERKSLEAIVGSNRNIRLEASVGILSDSTMAIEVALSGALLQWPYFHDMTLISSIANIFNLGSPQERALEDHPVQKEKEVEDISPWMYLNVLITDTELFVPVIDADIAMKLISELWKSTNEDRRNEFEKVADMILATMLIHSTDAAGVISVEDRGLSMDVSLLRFCYAYGGDGEIIMKSDLSDVAVIIRDPNARVHTVVQPMSASLDIKMQQPEAAERHEMKVLNEAATVIQRRWREYYMRTKVVERLRHSKEAGIQTEHGEDIDLGDQWKLVEKLAFDVATPRTKTLLEGYYFGTGKKGTPLSHVGFKSLSVHSICVHIGVFTSRLAFSHIKFWNSAIESFNSICREHQTDLAEKPSADTPVETVMFRPSGLKISAMFERIAVVLCNDKAETFGAPDVLHICMSDGEVTLDTASLLPDRPPNAVGHVALVLFSSFLNSGTSKWEPLVSPWPFRAEFIDSNGSGYASDRKLHCYLSSERIMEMTFNPASLMSIGDALAFLNAFTRSNLQFQNYQDNLSEEDYQSNVKIVSAKGISSSAPQKYLIQNQSGLKLFYWSEDTSRTGKKSPVIGLDPEASDTLKVLPSSKKLTLLNFNAAATGTERIGAVINLHFEGNWMPIHDVPINVVGKYKYSMISPADNTTVPVLVDVILVGRTKIITIHSGIWVENSIETPITFRLHVPTTSLVPPGIIKGKKNSDSTASDINIGPLKPGEGTYLPLIASLGGLLFLKPAGYQEATRDVIRLSINVQDLVNQQGYIVCNPPDVPGIDEEPLHVTMEVVPSKVLSEFQTFKHMEVVGPGTLQRASIPLEVTISIQPTMVFYNAMPFDMNVLLWQVGNPSDKQKSQDGAHEESLFDILSPRASMAVQVPVSGDKGQYFAFKIPAGGEASVYANVRRDILVHTSMEDVNMRTVKWSLCHAGRADAKERTIKMAKSLPLRMLDVGLEIPLEAFGIERYLERLKEGCSHLRSLHAQFRKDARKAVSSKGIHLSVAKFKSYTKKRSKKRVNNAGQAPPQTAKRATATSARPIPKRPGGIPSAPPYHDLKADSNSGVKKRRSTWRKLFMRKHTMDSNRANLPTPVPNVAEDEIELGDMTSHLSNRDVGRPGYTTLRPPPLDVHANSDDSSESYEHSNSQEDIVLAPPILNVSVHNQLHEKDGGSVSRITFYVPYWLNNRTGVDLFFKDRQSSGPNALGMSMPWEFVEVFAPGTSLTDALEAHSQSVEGSSNNLHSFDNAKQKIVLMNKQEELSVGLAHIGNRKYSQPIGIKTVGNKGTIELRGPVYQRDNFGSHDQTIAGPQPSNPIMESTEISPIDENDSDLSELSSAEADDTQNAIGAMKMDGESYAKNSGNADESTVEVIESNIEKKGRRGQQFRSFEFSIEVSAAPRNSIFRNTKLVNLKPKYIIENQTGIQLDVKQVGTPDLLDSDEPYEGHRRFARTLPHGSRTAVYWDDIDLPKELAVRPRLEDEDPEGWHWSGGFPIPDTEWYFGLRVRHKFGVRRYINIPVNVTVGSSGSVQVTLKSPSGVPPYRIENLCKDVQLFFVQVPLVFRPQGSQYVDSLKPCEIMPYAWDEPTMLTKLRVQAKVSGRQESRVADYALDHLGEAATLLLPTQDGEKKDDQTKKLYRSLSTDFPEDLKKKLVSLLAVEFSKRVYVTVYADGPTRVLQFSDEKNVSSSEHKHVVLDLAFRLKQVENHLRDVNLQFARLSGMQTSHYFAALDLYGRFPQEERREGRENDNVVTKSSRKLPMPESTRMLVKQASRQILGHSAASLGESDQGILDVGVDSGMSSSQNITPQQQISGVVRFEEDGRRNVPTSKSVGTIHSIQDSELSSELYELDRLDTSPFSTSARKESRDWGHVGSAHSAPRTSRRQATFQASSSKININQRQELLKSLIVGDANLLVGGDLNITVVQAQNLMGSQRNTHAFSRVRVRDAIPPPDGDMRAKQTSVVWQSVDPIWDEQVIFKDVCVASELVVELWDLGGTRSSKQMKALTLNPSEVIKTCRFLGRAEIPLSETLDVPAMTPLWYPLMRRTANDDIQGKVQLRFHWDVTTRGLMSIKLLALENVLAQRREILAALQPVQSVESLAWSKPSPDTFAAVDGVEDIQIKNRLVMPTIGLEMFRVRGEDNFSTITFHPSEKAIDVLNRHSQDHKQRHLVVTVLEARGLNPRSGVVVALSDNELPNPVVTIKLPGYPNYTTTMASHTLNPRWPANQRHIFRGVDPSSAEITVCLADQRTGIRRRAISLGQGVVHASNLKGDRPTYIWVPVYSSAKKSLKRINSMGDHAVPDLQVFLRLQWQKKVEPGSRTELEMDLAGAGMLVVGGLQDELFNFTVERLRIDGSITALEQTISGSINRLQLDNQTLNAGEPVVLAPDVGLRPTAEERPLIQFSLVQSFGAKVSVEKADKNLSTVEGCPKIVGRMSNSDSNIRKSADIRSFKKFKLNIDPLHLQTDEVFMESLLSFISSLPTSDIWQDEAWKDQQYRLLTAQFGPREVEALAVNAQVASSYTKGASDDGSTASLSFDPATYWLQQKESQDLIALRGQSDLSSWFFIESAEIGKVTINVSISLSSRVLSAGQSFGASEASDEVSQALDASGYQLVNVSNVQISFGKWMVGNDPSFKGKRTSNGFLSQKALVNNLSRHYTREILKEAHKVLGGAGPAVASVPLAVLWASGSTVVLLHEVSMGRAGPIGVLQQMAYVPLMTVSMLLSGFSRMLAAGMAVVPPTRIHGDDDTVRRLVKRPSNAIEALTNIPQEVVLGFSAAAQGFLYDPIAGWHSGNVPGLCIGFVKGIVGVPVRPLVGIFEATSDFTGAIAMTSLGREGIVGKTLQRVRAPGAFLEETVEGAEYIEGEESPAVALKAAWQRVLQNFFPEMVGEQVKEVMNVRPTRVILITSNHVAYLKARHHVDHSVYKTKWVLPSSEIQNIQGDPESRKIGIIHVRKYDLKIFGVWPVQMRKALRCENRSLFDRTVLRLTKVQQAVQAGRSLDEGGQKFVTPVVKDLTLLSHPYIPPKSRIEEIN